MVHIHDQPRHCGSQSQAHFHHRHARRPPQRRHFPCGPVQAEPAPGRSPSSEQLTGLSEGAQGVSRGGAVERDCREHLSLQRRALLCHSSARPPPPPCAGGSPSLPACAFGAVPATPPDPGVSPQGHACEPPPPTPPLAHKPRHQAANAHPPGRLDRTPLPPG